MHRDSRTGRLWAGLALLLGLSVMSATATAEEKDKAKSAFSNETSFANDIQPILVYRCLECHKEGGKGEVESGLRLDSYEGLMKGTKNGKIIIAGNALASTLTQLVSGQAALRMPHNKKPLTTCEIEAMRRWIQQGAKNN
ncbi:MAG: hypothetical protein H7833_03150 [Magnetococcus sp. DMHC-1]|nr:hypothetical protein [Magnetococcales bacterium]